MKAAEGGAAQFRHYLAEAYEGGLDALVTGVDEAVAGGFQRIWLNDHEELAGELSSSGTSSSCLATPRLAWSSSSDWQSTWGSRGRTGAF